MLIIVKNSTTYFVAHPFFHFHGNTEHFTLLTDTRTPTTIKKEGIVAFP
jgi:hypothetical protein